MFSQLTDCRIYLSATILATGISFSARNRVFRRRKLDIRARLRRYAYGLHAFGRSWAMSSVTVVPDMVSQAAGQLETIGSALDEAHASAAAPTTAMATPAADEVSAAVTALMNKTAQEYQALSAQVAKFHSQFVDLLKTGVGSYSSTEAANAAAIKEPTHHGPFRVLHPRGGRIEAETAAAAIKEPTHHGPFRVLHPRGGRIEAETAAAAIKEPTHHGPFRVLHPRGGRIEAETAAAAVKEPTHHGPFRVLHPRGGERETAEAAAAIKEPTHHGPFRVLHPRGGRD